LPEQRVCPTQLRHHNLADRPGDRQQVEMPIGLETRCPAISGTRHTTAGTLHSQAKVLASLVVMPLLLRACAWNSTSFGQIARRVLLLNLKTSCCLKLALHLISVPLEQAVPL
jgi:hypothetical protein